MAGFLNLGDQARGAENLGGIYSVQLADEGDFTAATFDWPQRSDIGGTGEITTAIPLTGGTQLPRIRFSVETGGAKWKKVKGGRPGNECFEHGEIMGEVIGDDLAQWLAIDKSLNKAYVAFVTYPNGKRKVFGTLQKPLQLVSEGDSGVKGSDEKARKLTLSPTGFVNFEPPFLGSGVVITALP